MRKFIAAAGLMIWGGVVTPGNSFAQAPIVVETVPIAEDAFSTGTLSMADGALSERLWENTDRASISQLLSLMPAKPATPAIGELMRRLLLTSADGPVGDNTEIGGKKLLALANAGFVDEAISIASLSTASRSDVWANQVGAIRDLLDGEVNKACGRSAALTDNQEEPFWVRLRALCYAVNEERDAADLTLSILRESGGLTDTDEALYRALIAGGPAKLDVRPVNARQYAMARRSQTPILPGRLARANGSVLVAVARDSSLGDDVRIEAAQRAVAAGIMGRAELAALLGSVEFGLAEFDGVDTTMSNRSSVLTTDALVYQSIQTMSAPEFLRDKAKRIAGAIMMAKSPARAYALSRVYGADVAALDGVLVAPREASVFASVAMVNGDAVGAAKWMQSMLGANASISALPQETAIDFIEKTNLLAHLDADTAARLAAQAGVAIDDNAMTRDGSDTGGTAQSDVDIIAAAFDAAVDNLPGQAGLAALAASEGFAGGSDLENVIIGHTMRIAGLPELERRFVFERTWLSSFTGGGEYADGAAANGGDVDDDGLTPRVKPRKAQ